MSGLIETLDNPEVLQAFMERHGMANAAPEVIKPSVGTTLAKAMYLPTKPVMRPDLVMVRMARQQVTKSEVGIAIPLAITQQEQWRETLCYVDTLGVDVANGHSVWGDIIKEGQLVELAPHSGDVRFIDPNFEGCEDQYRYVRPEQILAIIDQKVGD